MVESIELFNFYGDNILDEDFEFFSKISLKMLTINSIEWSVENIKMLALLNWTNIDAYFSQKEILNLNFWFIKTPIQLFDSQSGRMWTYKWESIKFFIEKDKIEKIKLLKVHTENFLFIPLDTIARILCSGFSEISSAEDINKKFADFDHQFDIDGFVVPMEYFNKIFFELDYFNLEVLNQYKNINNIFKEKHIGITIGNLGRLLEINKLFPDDFSKFSFKYNDELSTDKSEYSISEILDNLDWINLKFIEIYQSSILLSNQFQFWWNMLRSRRTRFSLTLIHLEFSLLSECLTVLSLCSGCPELKSIRLRYLKIDIDNKQDTVEHAKREFIKKFGPIQNLTITKH